MSHLSDLLFGNRFVETYDIGGHKFEMQSLWKREELDVLRKIQGLDMYQTLEASKIPTLARAIISIDKVPLVAMTEVRDEIKKDSKLDPTEACEIALSNLDGGLIDLLFSYYIKLKQARDAEREKSVNFTQAPNNGASTESASSSDASQKS